MSDNYRFRDPTDTLSSFVAEFLVVCPQCSSCARVIPVDLQNSELFAPRRLVCRKCGYTTSWRASVIGFGDEYDSYFGLPLWLQTPVGDKILWAYNLNHLELIESFVRTLLRERRSDETGWHNKSIISRLPDWIKAAKNRKHILKAIAKIKRKSSDYDTTT